MSLLCDCCHQFPCAMDVYLAKQAQERKERMDKLVLERLMKTKCDDFHDKEELVVGHSEATPVVNTVEFRGVQSSMELIGPGAVNPTVEPKKQAMRFDANKLRLDLIPPEFLIELARVYTMGALKYDDDNWRKGMPWRKVYRPIWSHLIKWLSGHTIDSETGCHHLAMVAWNCATLFMYQLHKLGTDDRQKFAIDESFNWVDNHLGIGLDDSKITELKDKYKQQRENAK